MIAFLFFVAVISVGNAVPISDAASGAQDRDFFAEKLVDCVKTKRDSYSEATKTFSGFVLLSIFIKIAIYYTK